MDDEPDLNARVPFESIVNDTGPAPYAGAFFPNSQNLRIQGGVFTSYVTNTTQVPPSLPSDFRMIPMGDIDLRQQIRLDGETGMVDFLGSRRGGVRRMYTAKIAGLKSNMTVALYEGGNAEEAWRRDFTAYSNIRHPNVFQIYGAARSNEIHATIIHGDLIPLEHVWKLYRHSHFAATYMLAYCSTEFQEAEKYCDLLLQTRRNPEPTYASFIRSNTGRLCVDAMQRSKFSLQVPHSPQIPAPNTLTAFNGSNPENVVIASLSLPQYEAICHWKLRVVRGFQASAQAMVRLGEVRYCPAGPSSGLEGSRVVAFIPTPEIDFRSWDILPRGDFTLYDIGWSRDDWTRRNWSRYTAAEVCGVTITSHIVCHHETAWLSQANHVFNSLRIGSNYDDYVLLEEIQFQITISEIPRNLPEPEGYLFLCPTGDFQFEPGALRWPDCPAYWSLDRSGLPHLSSEEATELGFPTIKLKVMVEGACWDGSVYAGLRKFHQGKGFDPNSQQVARHLGDSLFKLSPELDIPFAHGEGKTGIARPFAHIQEIEDENSASHEDATREESVPARDPQIPFAFERALSEPSRTWKIIMGVQFALMLTVSIHWVHDLFFARQMRNP